jgi:hypothetical protein
MEKDMRFAKYIDLRMFEEVVVGEKYLVKDDYLLKLLFLNGI